MEKKLAVKDIAALADVSVATVSRVINQNGRFSKETERRVLEVMANYNYIPNQLARGLRTNRTSMVGIVVPDITNEYFANLVLKIQKGLFQAGFMSTICNFDESEEIARQNLIALRAQNISGLVYINGLCPADDPLFEGIPTIFIDREPMEPCPENALFLSSDNFRGGYLAAQALYSSGARQLAVMTERENTYVTRQRLEGFRKFCLEQGLELPEERILVPAQIKFEAARSLVQHTLRQGVEFDGIFCQTDWLASGALVALREAGRQVPGDVRLVGFDNISISFLCQQPFTTVKQDVESMGEFVSHTLTAMIRGDVIEKKHIQFPVELIVRQTT